MSGSQPTPTSLGLQAPPAPSNQETVADSRPTLQWISDRLAQIYSLSSPATTSLTRTAYASIYTVVWNFCRATKDKQQGQERCTENSKDLYSTLEQAICAYCRESLQYITAAGSMEPANNQVLVAYTEQWSTFLHLSGLVTHLLQPLDDRWIRRVIATNATSSTQSQKKVRHIPQLHASIWEKEVLKGSKVVMEAVVAAQQQQGQKGEEDQKALEGVLASLSRLGELSRGSSAP